ncbi:MAG TPA: HAD family phosphatase [Cyclobacteriaceae bacterium]|nr:HAD family phosphatase [Cyclobacteriaceae bacterium]
MTLTVAVILDMDGVIIDSNPAHKIALKQFCEKYGYQLDDDQLLKRIYGRTNKEWIADLFGRKLTAEEVHYYEEEKEEIFRQIFKNDLVALPGLPHFLTKLKEHNIPCAIGTSAPRSNVDYVLAGTGIGKYFSAILDESDVEHGKPNPEIYLKVAARLKFPPAKCIVFEDSLSGIAAAQAAGCKVVGVTTTHSKEEFTHTDFTVRDFRGLDPVELIAVVFRES